MNNRRLTLLSLLMALVFVQTIIPGIGYLTIGPLSLTIIPVTVMITTLLLDIKSGMIIGGFWGMIVFVRSFVVPTSPLAVVFMNPLIAILPRLLIGLIVGLMFMALKKTTNVLKLSLLGAIGSLVNTIIFLILVGIFFGNNPHALNSSAILPFLMGILVTNGLCEMIIDAILLPLITKPLLKFFK